MFVDTFIRRPILASVCSLVIILAGAIAIPTLPIAQYPGARAAAGARSTAFYTGANAQAVETAVTTPLEQAINGVEGMHYMTSSSTQQRHRRTITVTFDVDARSSTSPRSTCRTASRRRSAGCRTKCSTDRHHGHEGVDRLRARAPASTPRTASTTRCSSATTSTVYVRTRSSACPGVGDVHHLRRAQVRDAPVARSRASSPAASSPPATSSTRCASRTSRSRPAQVGAGAGAAPDQTLPDQRPRRRPAAPSRREFDNIILKAGDRRRAGAREGRRPRRARRRELLDRACASTGATPSASACSQLPTANALARLSRRQRRARRGCRSSFPPGLEVELAFDTTQRRRASRSARCVTTLLEAIGLVVLVMFLFLQNWRTHADPGDHDPGVARRHVRVRQAVRLLDQHADAVRHHARHRPRRRRCDRGDREHRAAHPRVPTSRAREAASDAMGEVIGAVIATALVLVAVFVPVAFFPGTTGRLYQQFALTIAFVGGALGVQRADADAGAVGAAARRERARRRACSSAASNRVIDGGTRRLRRGAARG